MRPKIPASIYGYWKVAVISLLLLLPACGADIGSKSSGGSNATPDASSQGVSGSGVSGGDESGFVARDEDLPESAAGSPSEPDFEQKVVKTSNLGLQVKDVRKSASKSQRLAARLGGSVQSSQVDRSEGGVSATLVLSVPAPKFEEALDELRSLGEKVTTDAVEGQDVTEEYVDLESRQRNLVAAEKNLLGLYDDADSVKDSLSIQRELTKVRGEIEQTQGRMRYLERRTADSRIFVSIQPVAGSSEAKPGWDPGLAVARSWSASLSVLQAAVTAIISALVFGWWLVPALVAALVWWRRRNRRYAAQDSQRASGG